MFTKKSLCVFVLLSCLGIFAWIKFTYPQVAFINLSIDRAQALRIARDYMRKDPHQDPNVYRQAAMFGVTRNYDQYLQKVLGYWGEIEFLKKYHYDLFYWTVRFYKENEKEQYYVTLSASTGEVVGFTHDIKDTETRPTQTEEAAKIKAITFLEKTFQFNPDLYTLTTSSAHKFDNRTDYSFAWERKGVYIPWSTDKDTGGAKLRTSVLVSGDEIRSFSKHRLDVPESFYRYIARQMTTGNNLGIIFRIIFFSLLTTAIFLVAARRNNLVMHTVKQFCIALSIATFIAHIAGYWNEFETVLFNYDSTSPLASYLWRHITNSLFDTFIITLTILMPCLAGESLRHEVAPQHQRGAFLHYLLSTVFSRGVGQLIILGYFVAAIMIGVQAAVFEFGQRYLGVWVEYTWMTQLSSSYFPFLTALIVGFVASTSEEVAYRLFAINLGKKIFKSTIIAVLFSSLIWGYGHSGYMVFPMWFRGIEVTCLGLFLSYIYLRYGIIATLTAHYLFDVFWENSPYLLGQSTKFDFYSCLTVFLLPLVIAAICYWRNQPETEGSMRWKLTLHQKFNLEVLKNYLQQHPELLSKPREQLVPEIMHHGWDIAVVEFVLDDLQKPA